MKTFFTTLFVCTLILTTAPQTTQAYKTTSQSARQYGDTTAVFQITYRFGFLTRELYMPIAALRGGASTTRDAVGFTLVDKTGAVTPLGSTNAVVLSTAMIKDGMYYVPPGKAADFTFTAVVNVPAGTSLSDYHVQMTSLPFVMVDKGKKINAQLNPSELQYYKTPTAGMNSKLFSDDRVNVTGITYTLKTKE